MLYLRSMGQHSRLYQPTKHLWEIYHLKCSAVSLLKFHILIKIPLKINKPTKGDISE